MEFEGDCNVLVAVYNPFSKNINILLSTVGASGFPGLAGAPGQFLLVTHSQFRPR